MTNKSSVLELKNVSKHYQIGTNKIKALNKINFKAYEGELVAIMGPSGSGKSTFLQVSSILAQPTSGHIYLKNKEVTQYNEVDRAKIRNKEIGFIFQQFNLLKKTSALENVALPLVYAGIKKRQRQERAKQMLKKVGLGERLHNTPAQLSGGQQQRVAIARALVNHPSIIFADEPTGNLDSKSGTEVEQMLQDLNKEGKTIIIVTHEEQTAKIAKRLVYLKDGAIIADNLINSLKDIRKITNANT